MALDTRDKRASALGRGLGFLAVLPLPDGGVDQGDRQQVAGYYRGILAGLLVVVDMIHAKMIAMTGPSATAVMTGPASSETSLT